MDRKEVIDTLNMYWALLGYERNLLRRIDNLRETLHDDAINHPGRTEITSGYYSEFIDIKRCLLELHPREFIEAHVVPDGDMLTDAPSPSDALDPF